MLRLLYLLPAGLHAGLIYALSDRALPALRFPLAHWDKLAHGTVFAVLAVLVAWGLARAWPRWPWARVLLLALLVSVAYGALDEVHQRRVPGRTPDPMDLMADGLGAGVVVAVLWWRARRSARPAA